MTIAPADQALFDARPPRLGACPFCHGCGTKAEIYALRATERFDGAPADAICAYAIGDIFEAVKEAIDLANRAGRAVAFEFNGKMVIARAGDVPDVIARAWWQAVYNETPEESFAKR